VRCAFDEIVGMCNHGEGHSMRESMSGSFRGWKKPFTLAMLILLGLVLFALGFWTSSLWSETPKVAVSADGSGSDPALTTPESKIAELSDEAFTGKLFDEFTSLEARLKEPGTQVHMVFWSGPGNHGNALNLVDAIDSYVADDGSIHKGVWGAGVNSSLQNPSFITMNREAWYERAYPEDGKMTVFGVVRTDVAPVTPEQADTIWGLYSRRYSGQATLFKEATGKPVEVWCFVVGAKAKRIFYTNEFPVLQQMEAAGVVNVHFAKTADADWTDPSDWTHGTANHPAALEQ
jgi:hypothetical protein